MGNIIKSRSIFPYPNKIEDDIKSPLEENKEQSLSYEYKYNDIYFCRYNITEQSDIDFSEFRNVIDTEKKYKYHYIIRGNSTIRDLGLNYIKILGTAHSSYWCINRPSSLRYFTKFTIYFFDNELDKLLVSKYINKKEDTITVFLNGEYWYYYECNREECYKCRSEGKGKNEGKSEGKSRNENGDEDKNEHKSKVKDCKVNKYNKEDLVEGDIRWGDVKKRVIADLLMDYNLLNICTKDDLVNQYNYINKYTGMINIELLNDEIYPFLYDEDNIKMVKSIRYGKGIIYRRIFPKNETMESIINPGGVTNEKREGEEKVFIFSSNPKLYNTIFSSL